MPHGDNAKRQMKRPAPILVAETSVAHESSFFPFNPLAAAQFAFISNRMASKTPKKRDIVKPQRAGKLGEVRFDLGRFELQAKYLRVPASTDADRLDLIGVESQLKLDTPQLLVSVVGETGSFGTLTLDRGLELSLTRGLASVARSTLTWVITGGCDGGVMRWAGEATSGNLGKGACIGIAPWQKIKQVEVVQANGQDRYTAQGIGDATESTNAALEKHHTHFLLVDDDSNPQWGSELDLARRLREYLCLTLQVPLVTLVIAGTIGNLRDVIDALNCSGLGAAVVVVRESGGCAQAVAEFVELWRMSGASLSKSEIGKLLSAFEKRLEELVIKTALEVYEINHARKGKEPGKLIEEKQKAGEAKREEAKGLLMDIVLHSKCDERLRIFSQRRGGKGGGGAVSTATGGSKDSSADDPSRGAEGEIQHEGYFDRFLLEVIVRSYALDVELRERRRRRANLTHDSRGGRRPLLGEVPHEHCRNDDLRGTLYEEARQSVADHLVPWDTSWEGYSPPDYTTSEIKSAPYADPEDPRAVKDWEERQRKAGQPFKFDRDGRPLNPRGRTGLRGRGSLPLWGPNHAFDPVVTRMKIAMNENSMAISAEPKVQMLAFRRPDLRFGIPGVGKEPFIDFGEKLNDAFDKVAKEISAEKGEQAAASFRGQLERLLEHGKDMYTGYVDDPRNTDNAWQVTRCCHYHIDNADRELARALDRLNEAKTVVPGLVWLDMDRVAELRYVDLYAVHRGLCDAILHRLLPHSDARDTSEYPDRTKLEGTDVPWAVHVPGYDDQVPDAYNYVDKDKDGALLGDPIETVVHGDGDILVRTMDEEKRELFRATDYPTLRMRGTYELVQPFDERRQLPRNPRGRTGMGGRGKLYCWGPNHAFDLVITRDHPTTGKLELMVVDKVDRDHRIILGDSGRPWMSLPGSMIRKKGGADAMLKEMRSSFETKCLVEGMMEHGHNSEDTTEVSRRSLQLESLLADLFTVKNISELYRGYVDDPRNTDNAWIETTCYGFHCSKELGALLQDDDLTGMKVINEKARWIEPGENCEYLPDLWGAHEDLAEAGVMNIERKKRTKGLLSLAVDFGVPKLVSYVLREEKVGPERTPFALHSALHTALASHAKNGGDLAIIIELLENGAHLSDVSLIELCDETLTKKKPKFECVNRFSKIAKTRFKDEQRETKDIEDQMKQKMKEQKMDCPQAELKRAMTLALTEMKPGGGGSKAKTTHMSDHDGQRVHRELFEEYVQNVKTLLRDVQTETWRWFPWPREYVLLLDSLIPGFATYAKQRATGKTSTRCVTAFDLMCWALLCGDVDLALLMWERSDAPLRAALIGKRICLRLREEERFYGGLDSRMLETLKEGERGFAAMMNGTLDFLPHEYVPDLRRQLLWPVTSRTSSHEITNIGLDYSLDMKVRWLVDALHSRLVHGSRRSNIFYEHLRETQPEERLTILEMATEFEDEDFTAHNECADVKDEVWRGRHPKGGTYYLTRTPLTSVLWLQLLTFFVPVMWTGVRMELNDMHKDYEQNKAHEDKKYYSYVRKKFHMWLSFWNVPIVKRFLAQISHFALFIFFTYCAFRPMCDEDVILPEHYALAAWTLAYFLKVLTQLTLDGPDDYFKNFWHWIDVLLVLMLSGWFALRVYGLLSGELRAASHFGATDLISSWGDAMHKGEPTLWFGASSTHTLRPGGRRRDDTPGGWPRLHCAWSPLLEGMRTLLGLSAILLTIRVVETFTFNSQLLMMRIIACLQQMYRRDLLIMIPILLIAMFGFGVSFSLASPNFQLENSDGPLLPVAEWGLDLSSSGAFWQPFWGIHGFFDIAEFGSSPSATFFSPFVLFLYLFFFSMPFINLLIAMFSESYEIVDEARAMMIWRLRDVQRSQRYTTMYWAPVPLNLVFLPIHLFSFAIAAGRRRLVAWLCGGCWSRGRNGVYPDATAVGDTKTSTAQSGGFGGGASGAGYDMWIHENTARQRFLDAQRQKRDQAESAQSAIDERFRALHDRADDSEGRIVAAIRDLLVEHQAPSTRKPAPIVSRDAPAHRTAPSLQGQGAAAAAPKNMKLQVVPAAVPYPERNGWKAPLLPPQPSQPLPPIAHAQEVQQEVQDTASIMVETAGKGGEEPRKPWAPSATPASPSAVPLTIPNRSRRGAPPTNL